MVPEAMRTPCRTRSYLFFQGDEWLGRSLSGTVGMPDQRESFQAEILKKNNSEEIRAAYQTELLPFHVTNVFDI